MTLRVKPGAVAGLRELLEKHPHVQLEATSSEVALEFDRGDWARHILAGSQDENVFRGLVELIDNNPLVCADRFSVPDPASTLALIAVGPMIRSGLLVESPTILFSFDADEEAVDSYLRTEKWMEGATVSVDPVDLGTVLACTAIAVIRTPDDEADIDALYDEAYGRSFYVREAKSADWDTALVKEKPYAVYRLRYAPDRPNSLLTVQVMADRGGKCGAAQIVHAMNVMAGFEESLGVDGTL